MTRRSPLRVVFQKRKDCGDGFSIPARKKSGEGTEDMTAYQKRKNALIFGAVALFLCGIGDWLIGYEPPGGEPLVFGITRTSIAAVPTWLYVLSLFFGILSGFGCRSFAPAMIGILEKSGVPGDSKTVRLFRFGLSSAPMMFVSFHAACCIVLIMIQAALRRGLDVKAADSAFLLPAAVLLPFVLWCFLCDVPVSAAFVYFVLKGWLKLPKASVICCPLGMSLAAKAVGAILIAAGSPLAFLASCGESWGYAFMCLAFAASLAKTEKKDPP